MSTGIGDVTVPFKFCGAVYIIIYCMLLIIVLSLPMMKLNSKSLYFLMYVSTKNVLGSVIMVQIHVYRYLKLLM